MMSFNSGTGIFITLGMKIVQIINAIPCKASFIGEHNIRNECVNLLLLNQNCAT